MIDDRQFRRLTLLTKNYTEVRDYYMEKCVNRPTATPQEISLIILSNEINELAISLLTLYKNKATIGMDSLNRIILEKRIYIAQILKSSDSARAFLYKKQLLQFEMKKDIFENEEFQNGFSKMLKKPLKDIQKGFEEKFKLLNESTFQELHSNYKTCFNYEIIEGHLFQHKWYNFNKKTNTIKKLAKQNNLIDEYITLYHMFSFEIHSINLNSMYSVGKFKNRTQFGINDKDGRSFEGDDLAITTYLLLNTINHLLDAKKMTKKMKSKVTITLESTLYD